MNNQQTPGSALTGKKFIPGIAWFFVTLFLFCLPGTEIPAPEGWWNKIYLDKWIHVGIFTVLAYLFMLPVLRSALPAGEKWSWCIKITLSCLVWGLAVECIQEYFITERSFDLVDWAADSLGALIALWYIKMRFARSLSS